MRKDYAEPALEVRKYLIKDIFTDSDPGLHDGDEYGLDSIDDGDGDGGGDYFLG